MAATSQHNKEAKMKKNNFRSHVYGLGRKIKSFRKGGYIKSAAKLTAELQTIVTASSEDEKQWIADVVFGMGHSVADLTGFLNHQKQTGE